MIRVEPQLSLPSTASSTVLGIDGNSLLYRAYFALPNSIRDPSGRPVNAVYGFVSMLARLLRDQQPDELLIAYDSAWPTLRHHTFPNYKANRQALPQELLAQVSILQTLLEQTGIAGVAVAGYEGDDILATLARRCAARQVSLLLVTGDRDLFQLVRDPWVRVLYTKRGVSANQVLDEDGVRNLVGVPPSRYSDLAALRGDASDNIPGISGIGTKSAIQVINLAASFEALFSDPGCLPSPLGKKLLDSRDLLLRNRELMRLVTNVPVNWDALSLSLNIDWAAARDIFDELGLGKLYETLLAAITSTERTSPGTPAARATAGDITLQRRRVCLVACCAEKKTVQSQAKDLYISPLFKKSRSWAEMTGGPWFILSALHGVVRPETMLQPYDTSLKNASLSERESWGKSVVADLTKIISQHDVLYVLTGNTYLGPILPDLMRAGFRVAKPLEGMSIGKRLKWLNAELEVGQQAVDLEAFYEILTWLAAQTGGSQLVATGDQRTWPERGVYFFFEPDEYRLCSTRQRVVRVGTHAVSVNSKATLWNRLRTHRGVLEGGGNHRASIFRSHMGTAILHRDGRLDEFPQWGNQAVGIETVKAAELELERIVSAVLSQMRVLSIEVPDVAGARSDRAYIERNAIALLSRIGSRIDRASEGWLGRWSPHPAIKKSGLWNVNYVEEPAWDERFLEVFDYYARATAGKTPFLGRSVAPDRWWDRSASPNQLNFQWNIDGTRAD